MTVTINAVASIGLVQTSDGSGQIKIQSNGKTTNALAWCNFTVSGTTPTVAASYNVSSITYNGTGDWTATFTNAMTDANYAVAGFARISANGGIFQGANDTTFTTTTFRFGTTNSGGTFANPLYATFIVHGN